MSIVVEHDKRRTEILEKALDVFVDEGFENATYQKIAARSGITRTTLYLYFRNKREIFNYSIKQLLTGLEEDLNGIRQNKKLTGPEKILKTLFHILYTLEKNRRLLSVVLDFLLYLSKSAENEDRQLPDTRVRRRTVRLRHILAIMVIDGIKAGEIKKMDIRAANELFYSFIESAIFRLAVLKRQTAGELRSAIELAVENLRV